MVADFAAREEVRCYAHRKCPGGLRGSPLVTLTLVDVAAVTAVVVGPVLVASFGVAFAWLRADAAKLEKRLRAELAKLDERQRADTAGLRTHMAKLDERQRADTTSLLAHIAKLDERQRADTAAMLAHMAKLDERQRADIAQLDERQRADTAAINMRLDTLTQTIITSTIARGSQSDLATERASQAVQGASAKQP